MHKEIKDHEFIGWNIPSNSIALEDKVVIGTYKKNTIPIIIKDKEGNVLKKFKDDSIINTGGGSSGIYYQNIMPEDMEVGDIWMMDINDLSELDLL